MDFKQILSGIVAGAIISGTGSFFLFQDRISKLEAFITSQREQLQNTSNTQTQQPASPKTLNPSALNPPQPPPAITINNNNKNEQSVNAANIASPIPCAKLKADYDMSLSEIQKFRSEIAFVNDSLKRRAKLLEKAKEWVYADLKKDIEGELQ